MKRKKARRKVPARKAAARQKKVSPVPAGYHSVTPYLSIRGAAQAIEFYKKALGAKEIMRMPGPDGTVGHAELQIGDSRVMLADRVRGDRVPQSAGARRQADVVKKSGAKVD